MRIDLGGTPTYQAVSSTLVSSGTAGATTISLGILWHAATVNKTYKLIEIGCSWSGGTGGDPCRLFARRISADGSGGTALTGASIEQSLSNSPVSDASFRFGATTSGTSVANGNGASISLATPGERTFFYEQTKLDDQPDTMRGGLAEGFEVILITGAAGPSVAAQFASHAKWTAK